MAETLAIKVLLVEGHRGDHPSFNTDLVKKGCDVCSAPNGSSGIEQLETFMPDVIVIDAASLRTSGTRICQSFRKIRPEIPLILILPAGADVQADESANITMYLPFTAQKLANRLKAFRPTDGKTILTAGPIQLILATRQIICDGRQSKLTPRLMKLLKLLIENKGSIVKREPLFRQVWDTDYTGDTRTLDVHISWLRQIIEEDPRKPKILITVRGEGYKLDL